VSYSVSMVACLGDSCAWYHDSVGRRFHACSVYVWHREPHQSFEYQWIRGATCCSSQHHPEGSSVHRGRDQYCRGLHSQFIHVLNL